ncbi:MAG: hypothetical protein Q7S53_00170, partial [bacterium]|nr:hypothetical protein [bacterium]
MTKFKKLTRNIFKIKKKDLLLFAALLSLFIVSLHPIKAEAALNNSYVIPDVAFANAGTMNEAQIQAFLVSHGSYLASYTVPAERDVVWHNVSYHESPWIGPIGSEVNAQGRSAAWVIYQTSQWYGINPQVLIATLQKESSLVTNSNPPYYGLVQWAMGYAYTEGGILNVCGTSTNHNPTGSCAGFAMQMDWAGGGLKSWMNWANAHSPSAGQYWTGNTLNIDGQSVYLGNGATAALYRYTPHIQTNFYNIYAMWFNPYSYQVISSVNPPQYLAAPFSADTQLVLRNTGTTTWYGEGTAN